MGWTAPPAELTNYRGYVSVDSPGNDLGTSSWYDRETMAWVCNQSDDCKGFNFTRVADMEVGLRIIMLHQTRP
jgi:hypothetical protein